MLSKKELLEMSVGDCLYECESGINYKFEVLTKPVLKDEQITWQGKGEDGRIIDYLTTPGGAYAVRIYKEPEYI